MIKGSKLFAANIIALNRAVILTDVEHVSYAYYIISNGLKRKFRFNDPRLEETKFEKN